MSGHRCRIASMLTAALLCLCTAAPRAWAENHCAGGGKPRPDEGGIGGTGVRPITPDDDDSGIGGTGISAAGETGIVGTITGFASICVAGVEIHYDVNSAVEIDGQPAAASDLAVGQVVEVIAAGTGDEVHAREIAVRHIVAGPITGSDAERGTLDVMGQTIQLPDAQHYEIGQYVRVSGLRRADGAIVASLVTIGGGEHAQVVGPVGEVAPVWLSVGGTRISAADARVAVGDEVRVTGRWDGTQLVSASIEPRPRLPFDGRISRVEIEGFATKVTGDQLRIGVFVFEVPAPQAVPDISGESRVRIQATIQERRAIVQNVGILSSHPPRPERGPESGRVLDPLGPGENIRRENPPVRSEAPPGARREALPPPGEARPEVFIPDAAKPEGPDRPERPMRPEPPPRIERPSLPQRVERPERPPRPERPDIPRRP